MYYVIHKFFDVSASKLIISIKTNQNCWLNRIELDLAESSSSASPCDEDTVRRTQAALLRCNATLRRCIKNCDDRGSAVTDAIRRPRSLKKADTPSPRAPRVSTAVGVNLYNEASERYFVVLRCSVASLYSLTPIAVETLGALGAEASAFFGDLGRRIASVTAEPRSLQFLMQRIQ